MDPKGAGREGYILCTRGPNRPHGLPIRALDSQAAYCAENLAVSSMAGFFGAEGGGWGGLGSSKVTPVAAKQKKQASC